MVYYTERLFCRMINLVSVIKSSRLNGRIIMYHHVFPPPLLASLISENIASCVCSSAQFRRTLENGLRISSDYWVTMDEAVDYIRKKTKRPFGVITFDDGTSDLFSEAYPILKELNIPFIVYVAVDFIGKPTYLSPKEINELIQEPLCTIGAHTLSHPNLKQTSLRQAYREIRMSKEKLETMTGCPVIHFAYPYGKPGAVDCRVVQCVKRARYESAVGTIDAPLVDFWANYIWYLPRQVEN